MNLSVWFLQILQEKHLNKITTIHFIFPKARWPGNEKLTWLTCRTFTLGSTFFFIARQNNQPEPVLLGFIVSGFLISYVFSTVRVVLRRYLPLFGAIACSTGGSVSFVCVRICSPTFDHVFVNMRRFFTRRPCRVQLVPRNSLWRTQQDSSVRQQWLYLYHRTPTDYISLF